MSFFSRFRNKNPTTTRMKMITEHGNSFYNWNGNLYESDIVRSCTRPFVKAIGKLEAKHIRIQNEDLTVNPNVNIRMLLQEPNPTMSMQMLLEKLAIQLKLNNNAFAYIVRNENDIPIEIYPIPCLGVEAVYDSIGNLFLKFNAVNGGTMTFAYRDIIHIRQDFNENDIFGDSPSKALTDLMNIIKLSDQSVAKAVKNSAVIRWLLKINLPLKDDDLKNASDKFASNFLDTEKNGTGVAAVDGKMDAQQIKQDNYVVDNARNKDTINRLYNFFGVNENIIQAKYTEDEWNAYYEAEIEPIAIQLGNELTRKIFSRKEIAHGNKIVFESSNLQCASMATKLNLLQMVDRGALSVNSWRQVLNLPPVAGGDILIRRLDTAPVKEGGNNDE